VGVDFSQTSQVAPWPADEFEVCNKLGKRLTFGSVPGRATDDPQLDARAGRINMGNGIASVRTTSTTRTVFFNESPGYTFPESLSTLPVQTI
jgi:hypothetical protein